MKKGSIKPLNLVRICKFCEESFPCADAKTSRCQKCRCCPDCGILTRSASRYCRKCQPKHQTNKQKQQLKRLHKTITGQNNPSKRKDVRQKLSDGKKGDKNPARIYREQYAAHIRKYRPGKISKIELAVLAAVPYLTPQYVLGGFTFDLADVKSQIVVEVQGCWFHSCQSCFPNSPSFRTQFYNQKNDIKKKQTAKDNGWRLIEIFEHDIRKKDPMSILETYQSLSNNK